MKDDRTKILSALDEALEDDLLFAYPHRINLSMENKGLIWFDRSPSDLTSS